MPGLKLINVSRRGPGLLLGECIHQMASPHKKTSEIRPWCSLGWRLDKVRPRQDGRHLADDYNFTEVCLRVQSTMWLGDVPLSEPINGLVYWHIYAPLGLSEFSTQVETEKLNDEMLPLPCVKQQIISFFALVYTRGSFQYTGVVVAE